MEYFLSKGANINSVDKSGSSALIYAALLNNVEMTRFLIKNGIDASIKNDNKRDAREYCLDIITIPSEASPLQLVYEDNRKKILEEIKLKLKEEK